MERKPFRYRPRFEALEERSQPAVFRVVHADDLAGLDGTPLPGTLRWAIQQANQHPNSLKFFSPGEVAISDSAALVAPTSYYSAWDVILFQMPPQKPLQVLLDRPLERVTEAVILDGSQQPGFNPGKEDGFPILTPELPDDASRESMWLINVWFELRKRSDQPRTPVDPRVPELLDEPVDPPILPRRERVESLDTFFFRPETPPQRHDNTWQRSRRYLSADLSELPDFHSEDESRIGKIMGTLFEDDDGDGVRDSEEPAAAARVVYLDLNHNGRLDEGEPTAVTNQQGEYRFEHLRPGTYHVDRVLWPHRLPTWPQQGGNVVDLTAGETIMDVDFGEVKVQKRRVPVSIPDGDSRRSNEPATLTEKSTALAGLAGLARWFNADPREKRYSRRPKRRSC